MLGALGNKIFLVRYKKIESYIDHCFGLDAYSITWMECTATSSSALVVPFLNSSKTLPIPTIPNFSSSTALRAPILAPPTTRKFLLDNNWKTSIGVGG